MSIILAQNLSKVYPVAIKEPGIKGTLRHFIRRQYQYVYRPQVLFLDEPTLGLDVNAQVAVREFLREYNQRYQATVLLTSHYMADITALCKRVLLIYQGELIYYGSLDGLLDRFTPYREVQIELINPIPPDVDNFQQLLSNYGEVETLAGQAVRLLVRRENLTTTVAQILAELEVQDLTVTDPPIEEIIGRVFRSGLTTEVK